MTENEVKNYDNFHLSMEVSKEFLHLLLINKSDKKGIAIETISLEGKTLKEALKESDIIQKSSHDTVSCAIQNSLFSLVPNSIFSDKDALKHLSFGHELSETTLVETDKLTKQEVTNCFGIEKETKEILSSMFPNIKYLHLGSVLIENLSEGMNVNFSTSNEFEVVYFKNKKLLFFNRYISSNKDESLYYLSLISEKLNLDIQNTNIKLSGKIDTNGELLSFWSQFIPKENLTFNEIETSQLNAISTHRFYSLHKQIQCV